VAENAELSNVVPVMVAALICDVAVADPATGKKNLIGIFDRLWSDRFPTTRPLSIYWKVTDAEGRYKITARFVQVKGNRVLGEAQGEAVLKGRLSSFDFLLPFPPVPFPEPGRYEFQILMNGSLLGSAFLDAHPRPQQPQKE
jgi:hypothetical protein